MVFGGKNSKFGLAFLSGSVALAPMTAIAQSSTVPSAEPTLVDEIIVTAQRRAESIQDVPISVSAFGSADLDGLRVERVEDLARLAPNLTFAPSADIKTSSTSLRGISTSFATAGADPAVGYYLDDVFLGNAVSANLDLFDIERIEVLRGPQGTLFGRNTIGGVINIATAEASDVLGGTLAAEYGNFDRRRVRANVSGPVGNSESIRFSVSGLYEKRDGYFENAFDGTDHGSIEQYSVRGRLDFDLGPRTTASLLADFRQYEQFGRAAETLQYGFGPQLLLTAIRPALPFDLNDDPFDYTASVDNEGEQDLRNWGATLRLRTELEWADLISITAYRDTRYRDIGDADFTSLNWLSDGDPEDTERVSQELRLENYREDRLGWTVGAYYYTQSSSGRSVL